MQIDNGLIKIFISWTKLKIRLHSSKAQPVYFREKEIWWASLGANIGYEQDGKNDKFERPILVLKKFNKDILWALPLTRVRKLNNKYYFQLKQGDEDSFLILSQIRLISSKRLSRKMRIIEQTEFDQINSRMREFFV
ncbi:MAG: type II toxin-antitoxin system PemK/MazF family toxin [bacterium]